mgnify:CR=1 FL=1
MLHSSFEVLDRSRDENEVRPAGGEESCDFFAHALGRAGKEDGLILVLDRILGSAYQTDLPLHRELVAFPECKAHDVCTHDSD